MSRIPGNSQEIVQYRTCFKDTYKRYISIIVFVVLQEYVQFEIQINKFSYNYRKGIIIDYTYRIRGTSYGMPICKAH